MLGETLPKVKDLTADEQKEYKSIVKNNNQFAFVKAYFEGSDSKYHKEKMHLINVILYRSLVNGIYSVARNTFIFKKISKSEYIEDIVKYYYFRYNFHDKGNLNHIPKHEIKNQLINPLSIKFKKEEFRKQLIKDTIVYCSQYAKKTDFQKPLVEMLAEVPEFWTWKGTSLDYLKYIIRQTSDLVKNYKIMLKAGAKIEPDIEIILQNIPNTYSTFANIIRLNYKGAASSMRSYLYCFKSETQKLMFLNSLTIEDYRELFHWSSIFFKYLPKEFLTKEICELAVEASGVNIKYVPKEFRDQEIIGKAIQKANTALKHISAEEINKRAVLKKALRNKRVLSYMKKGGQ
jgi:hypothetical protein